MKNIYTIIAFITGILLLATCNNADELPPLNSGYATEYILPDPVDLTAEERAYIEELENEYKSATSTSD